MDHYDDVVHGEPHPSNSIPNAAYPDAPYQPGTGGRPPPDAMMGIHNHQALYSMNYSTPSHASTVMGTSSLGTCASSPSLTQPSSIGHVSNYQHSPWPNNTIPDVPPPPYEPSRVPSSSNNTTTNNTNNNDNNTRSVTSHQARLSGSFLATPTDVERGRGGEVIPLQDMPTRPSATHPPPIRSSASSTVELPNNKPAPVMTIREHRRRGLKICLIVLIAFIIFAIALSVGIAMGVLKEYHGDRSKDGPYPPPPLGY